MRDARGGAALPPARRRVARRADRRAARRRAPDEARSGSSFPTSSRSGIFFDAGIVDGLRERLDGGLAASSSSRAKRRPSGADAARRRPRAPRRRAHRRSRGASANAAQPARLRGSTGRSATTRSRSGSTAATASTSSAWQPGHPNWMLDSDREGLLPRWRLARARDAALALQRAAARAARGSSSAMRAMLRSRPLQRPAAERRPVPRRRAAARSSRWSRTSRAGTTPSARASISPHCDLYVVQNRVMEDDLRRYHGIGPERVRVTGWPQTDVFLRRRPRAEYEALLRGYGLDPRPSARARHGEHADERALRGTVRRAARRLVGGGARERLQLLFRPHPRDKRVARALRRRARIAQGVFVQEPSYTRPRGARDAAPARRRRRLRTRARSCSTRS